MTIHIDNYVDYMCLYVHNYKYAHVYVCMISYLDSLFHKSRTVVKEIYQMSIPEVQKINNSFFFSIALSQVVCLGHFHKK